MAAGCSLIVLAGGRSLRMGRDKARLPAGHESLVERIINRLAPVVDEVILVGMAGAHRPPGVRSVDDQYPNAGPLAGIHAGLRAAARDHAWVVGCDLPDVEPALCARLQRSAAGVDAVVPRIAGEPQGVCALYAVTLAARIERLLEGGRRSVAGLLAVCSVRYLDEGDLREVDPTLRSFRNLNTAAEYEAWVRAQPESR